jgi:hypothetical protein
VRLVRKDLARARTVDDLAHPIQFLDSVSAGAATEAGQLRETLLRIRDASDSSAARAAASDLRLFLVAEVARDTLAAPHLAGSLFRRIAEDWPDSPYAPKALLAVGVLEPAWADSARTLLDTRYSASSYVAYVRGFALPEYKTLEDSLQAFAVTSQARRMAPAPRPGQPVAPGGRRQPTEQQAPGATRRRFEP